LWGKFIIVFDESAPRMGKSGAWHISVFALSMQTILIALPKL